MVKTADVADDSIDTGRALAKASDIAKTNGVGADVATALDTADDTVDFGKTLESAEKINDIPIFSAKEKQIAFGKVKELPSDIQGNAKRFFKGGSNKYDYFSAKKNPDNTYTLVMQKPGDVPGSKAIYYKIVDDKGITKAAYKETLDPMGNLVHRKEK